MQPWRLNDAGGDAEDGDGDDISLQPVFASGVGLISASRRLRGRAFSTQVQQSIESGLLFRLSRLRHAPY